MKTIFKYDVSTSITKITGPITKILCAGEQHGELKIWAEVDTSINDRVYEVVTIGTGWGTEIFSDKDGCLFDTHRYVGTVPFEDGRLIFHVYAKEMFEIPVKLKTPEKVKHNVQTVKNNTFTPNTVTMINPDVLRHFVR